MMMTRLAKDLGVSAGGVYSMDRAPLSCFLHPSFEPLYLTVSIADPGTTGCCWAETDFGLAWRAWDSGTGFPAFAIKGSSISGRSNHGQTAPKHPSSQDLTHLVDERFLSSRLMRYEDPKLGRNMSPCMRTGD
ncbi:hypothetical protein CPAR01_05618 [Colletotrichum paranaense]|uniref:Uncharacterized protein n=1 Tax=Colletotrichum paranaense TaxID=1914294 RepID=A0ABQ9SRT2_9PEZI|nr:uncharacterized protein CPAR01_05618 [Colletotrichum paranaense]KAK1542231.1 hypothetical protein CPAR01_05618 [Colletotrichum paranaense]